MELLKKLLEIMLDLLKKGFDLLRGQGLGDVAKKLGLAMIGLLVLVCTGKSLRALHRAKRKAKNIKKAVRRAEEVHEKIHARKHRGKKAGKKSLAKKLARKVLLG